jgi:hypothetical protein
VHEDYADLKAAVEAAGFFTTFQPIRRPGDRMVCASVRYTRGPRKGDLGGNSFWVAKRDGQWFLASWSPVIYRVPDPGRLADLCIQLLGGPPGHACGDFEQGVRDEFGLILMRDDAFID